MKDKYIWQARVLPAVALMLPALIEINVLAGLWDTKDIWPTVIANIVISLVIVLFANWCRYLGKRKESVFFKRWGGAATTRFLRCSNTEYNRYNKARVKEYWGRMVKYVPIPSDEEEALNPKAADEAYEAFVSKLRADTRSPKLYPLLQSENRNYGMWRNLCGVKPISIWLCLGFIVVNVALAIFWPTYMSVKTCCITSGALLLVAVIWLWVVNESRVKQVSECYAERLFETCLVDPDRLKEEQRSEK